MNEYEDYQFTIYEGDKKQHYDWHADMGKKHMTKIIGNQDGVIKLESYPTVIQLTDPSEYEGGGFWINHGDKPITERQNEIFIEGYETKRVSFSFSFFFLFHKAEPVTFTQDIL